MFSCPRRDGAEQRHDPDLEVCARLLLCICRGLSVLYTNSMDPIVLNDIPFELDVNELLARLHVDEHSARAREVLHLVDDARSIGKPKALYKLAFVESRNDNRVVIDGVTFHSRVLRVNIEHEDRIFSFLATCGRELDEWSADFDDMVHQFWADTIKMMAIDAAVSTVVEHIDEHYRPGPTSRMSPGEVPDWPTEEQASLFALLGDTEQLIGVELTDSFLMIPTKSVSGIRFATDSGFDSCQLCPREQCPGRRVPYDNSLYDRRYRKGVAGSVAPER